MTNKKPDTLLTTAEAADFMAAEGETLTVAGMRSLARFARDRGFDLLAPEDQWPDRRTRMYSLQRLEEYKEARKTRSWKIPIEEQTRLAEQRKAQAKKRRKERAAREAKEKAEFEAKIRAEVEAQLRAEYEAKLAKK